MVKSKTVYSLKLIHSQKIVHVCKQRQSEYLKQVTNFINDFMNIFLKCKQHTFLKYFYNVRIE